VRAALQIKISHQTGGCVPSGSASFSEKLVKGTSQSFGRASCDCELGWDASRRYLRGCLCDCSVFLWALGPLTA
jgi:hypothetical protein